MINLNQLIEEAQSLAPMPQSTVRLAQLVSSGECHVEDVAELVSYDPVLTLKLLRAANSAVSARSLPVTTAREAVAQMGTSQVLALAVASSAAPILKSPVAAYGLDQGALWRHSVAAAVAAETLPHFCQASVPPEAFTAALLHDIGKFVLARALNPQVLLYLRQAMTQDGLRWAEAESLLLEVNHGEIGGLIAQHWQLPPRIVVGIIHHHQPAAGAGVVCDVTHLASLIARRIEAGLDGSNCDLVLDPGTSERLGLAPGKLEALCPVALLRYTQLRNRFEGL